MIIKDLGVIKEPSGKKQHKVLVECSLCKQQRETRIGRVIDCLNICKKCKVITRSTIHGLNKHPLKNVHNTMKQRCNNKNHISYKNYGARGITVCAEWLDFLPFYNWAIENGYKKGLSIDRVNNDGNYEPDNCRWITLEENIVRNAKLSINDMEKIIFLYKDKKIKVKQISEKFNIDKTRIYQILKEKNIKRNRYV